LQDRYVEEMLHVKRYTHHAHKMQIPSFASACSVCGEEARHGVAC
jgi:hypothetical protein